MFNAFIFHYTKPKNVAIYIAKCRVAILTDALHGTFLKTQRRKVVYFTYTETTNSLIMRSTNA